MRRHPRSFDLDHMPFGELAQWYELEASCGACRHAAIVDKWALQRHFGVRTIIGSVARNLVCTCGNRISNRFHVRKMPR
ncbi:hypothetical protein M8R20_16550 [Pseudomonas sp. R2.Fl]|nr:hypothetical protein [Pseudomonas sp. R2.Fl]